MTNTTDGRPLRTIQPKRAGRKVYARPWEGNFPMPCYRIYADGREFGIDYASLASARRIKAEYAAEFPLIRYYIRKVS